MNFGSLKQFLEFKTIENKFKFAAQCQAETAPWLQSAARRLATRGQPEGQLGHGLAAQSSHGCGPRAVRAHAWSPSTGRAWGGALARSPAAQWRLASGKVLGSSTTAKRLMRPARWEVARLTEEVGRLWGGREQPARRRSNGGGRLSRAGKTPASTCRPVRGRGR
jgi:hypothetical protein